MMLLTCKLHAYEARQQKNHQIARRCSTIMCYIPRSFNSQIFLYIQLNPVFHLIEDMEKYQIGTEQQFSQWWNLSSQPHLKGEVVFQIQFQGLLKALHSSGTKSGHFLPFRDKLDRVQQRLFACDINPLETQQTRIKRSLNNPLYKENILFQCFGLDIF